MSGWRWECRGVEADDDKRLELIRASQLLTMRTVSMEGVG